MKAVALLLSTALCVEAPARAACDDAAGPAPLALPAGARVRFETTGLPGVRQRGVLMTTESDSFSLVAEDGRVLKVPLSSVKSLELRLERKGNAKAGLLLGIPLGLLMGATAPVDQDACDYDSAYYCSRGQATAAMAIGMGALGALIGALIKTDRWTPLALDTAGRPGPTARRVGPAAAFQVAIRF